jgi:NADH:ubiquinone oxidoreductase subunit 4 (chain M)
MSILTITIFFPFLASLLLLSFSRESPKLTKIYAALVTFLTLGLGIWLALNFQAKGGFEFEHVALEQWLGGSADIKYSVGLDGLSLMLFVFTTLIFAFVALASWSVEQAVREYFFFLLMLETCILGIFAATDLFLYYIFWEAMLIPMYFLIGHLGRRAAHRSGN